MYLEIEDWNFENFQKAPYDVVLFLIIFNMNCRMLHRFVSNSQENTCARISFLIKLQAKACNFIKKETLAQVFSRENCEISKNCEI